MPLSVPRSGTLLQKLNRSAVPHLLVTLWVGRWEGRVGRCLCSLGCALGRACALGGVGCSVSRLATKTQNLDRLQAGEVACAMRHLLVGSLEEGLTMPLPIVLIALGGECKS
jgi:hypothetical protein